MNVNRIILLIKRYFAESSRRDLRRYFVFLFIYNIVVSFFNTNSYDGKDANMAVLIVFLLSALFASKSFSFHNAPYQGVGFIMIPASIGEKLAASAILNHLYGTLLFLIATYSGIFIGTSCFSLIMGLPNPIFNYGMHFFNIDRIITLFFVQSLFIFGSIYFEKHSFGKTNLSLVLVSLVIVSIFFIMFKNLFETNFSVITGNFLINNLEGGIKFADMIFTAFLAIYFWILSYFRLRETEE